MQSIMPVELVLRSRTFGAGHRAAMAIINLTSDSFYVEGRHPHLADAVHALRSALEEGADIIDVGAVRAGQQGEWVSAAEEIERLRPFLIQLRKISPEAIVSVDSWRSEVVEAVSDLGVDLVNDTWAGHDPRLLQVAAAIGAGYVVSHTGGLPPRTDPVAASYPPEPVGVIGDVLRVLSAGAHRAQVHGIPRERIVLDPTLDFGKHTRHSLTLLGATDQLVALGWPLMQAISRKDFVGESLGLPTEDRLEGSLAATAIAAWGGAVLFRTHDVRATRRVLDMVDTIAGYRPPVRAVRAIPPVDPPQ